MEHARVPLALQPFDVGGRVVADLFWVQDRSDSSYNLARAEMFADSHLHLRQLREGASLIRGDYIECLVPVGDGLGGREGPHLQDDGIIDGDDL